MGLAEWLQELLRGRGAIYESCCTGTGTGIGICEAVMQRERSALRTYQFPPIPTREAGCRFRKVTRSEPGPPL